jgi:predicted aminopeptidase
MWSLGSMGIGAAAVVAGCLLTGCSSLGNLGYYWQQTSGHFAMMRQARPIADVLAEPSLDARVRQRLEWVQRMRRFAVDELKLPDNDSYTQYADLKRPYVLWNIVATPALSLVPKTWCFPVAGCVSYRGHFDQHAAELLASQLKAEGYDVNVYGVPAYSTLGWFADPVLNTFINYPEGELARLIFHELAHQVAYSKDDSTFNESFATAVEQLGVERYLARFASAQTKAEYQAFNSRREDFRALLLKHRQQLQTVYTSRMSDEAKRDQKRAVFDALRAEYQSLKQGKWGGFAGYDRFFTQDLNNAHLAGVATYTAGIAMFEKLFEAEGRDFARFYARVKSLAATGKAERDAQLAAMK